MNETAQRTRKRAADSSRDGAAATDVLIVSADFDTRAIFSVALRRAGFTVRELADPDDVVAAARGCTIVITDFPTTTGSGETVTSLLRSDPITRDITILNATTHVWANELTEAKAAGVDATLLLPAFPNRVVEEVRRLFEQGGKLEALHGEP